METSTPGGEVPGWYRPELQGLRAVAILLVVVYHVWLNKVSGGVDAFLLVSSFLMTLSLTRKAETGSLGLLAYWTHVFRRFLPLAAATIMLTLLATWLLLPETRWRQSWDHAWASLFYAENWRLIQDAANYYAPARGAASPFQHFWSLSIQGQVFLLWPLLFAVAALLARRVGRLRTILAVLFSAVFAVSFAWSLVSTASTPQTAYFDTRARLWEFAVGSLLALALGLVRLPPLLAAAAGWLGVAGLLTGGMVLDGAAAFPGYAALWPLVSAALVILAGQSGTSFGVDRLLSHRAWRRLGDWSYGLYLLHWPILVIWSIRTGLDRPDLMSGAVIIALSVAGAWALTALIERPLRSWRWPAASPRRALTVMALLFALVAAPLHTWQSASAVRLQRPTVEVSGEHPGAGRLLQGSQEVPQAGPIPDPLVLHEDWVELGPACEGARLPAGGKFPNCRQGRLTETPSRRVLLIGASHVQQFYAALAPIAEQYDWEVISMIRGGCQIAQHSDESADCREFVREILAYVEFMKPDLIVLQDSIVFAEEQGIKEDRPPGFLEVARPLLEAGIDILAFRDNPRFSFEPSGCALLHGADAAKCLRPAELYRSDMSLRDSYQGASHIYEVDPIEAYCPDGICQPVIGNVFVYIDDNHVTATYSRSMEWLVRQQLEEQGFAFRLEDAVKE